MDKDMEENTGEDFMEETILNTLREEHREIQMMLLKVERCKGHKKQLEYFDDLKRALIPHMEGEEQTLYAKLRNDVNKEDAVELANLAGYEHQEIKDMLHMLDDMGPGSEEWDELFDELKENVQIHFQEEETQIFSEVKEDFSKEELIQIASEFEEAKEHASYH